MTNDATKKIIRRTEEIGEAVNDMNKAMASTPEKRVDAQERISNFKKKFPDAKYIEPSVRIPTGGIRHPEWEKQREYLHEYVVGIFESQLIVGKIEFFLDGLPGDDYCKWDLPVNKPIGIPRYVAKHLNKNLCWKEMKPLGNNRDPQAFQDGLETTPFQEFETKRRGTFQPLNAY